MQTALKVKIKLLEHDICHHVPSMCVVGILCSIFTVDNETLSAILDSFFQPHLMTILTLKQVGVLIKFLKF